jgi:acetoin:2,6-dichlorophenolindophenol oxidoreductase subunit beta
MREITYAQAIREAMSEEMRRDENVYFLGEDIGPYGGAFGVSAGMFDEFGEERIRDTPISEEAIMGCAVGSAMTGMRPIVEIMFSDFVTVAMDMIVNQAAKTRYMFGGQTSMPIVVRGAGGSGTGAAGQHSQSVEAWIANVPGLKIVMPATPYDAKGLLKTAIRDNNAVIFLESKLLYRTKGPVPEEEYTIPLGEADVKREGADLTIVTYSRMLQRCLDVTERLAAPTDGSDPIDVEVIDIRSLIPLDRDAIIRSVRKTGKALIVHEACQTGGFGGEISASIADSEAFFYLDAPIRRLGGLDVPIPYNPTLEAAVVPTEDAIEREIRDLAAY